MADTQLPKIEVGTHNGRPTLLWDGKPYLYTSYFIRHVVDKDEQGRNKLVADREDYVRRLADLCRPFGQRGIHGYEIPVNIGWTGPEEWDFIHPTSPFGEPVDDQFRAAVSADPQARCMVNFLIHVPQAWRDAYPDEMELDDQGKRYEVSIGSDLYLEELIAHLPNFIRYIEE
ncbi:MAG TPA: hypothetical protein VGM23_03405, partial [Armatimonadota bacterium]